MLDKDESENIFKTDVVNIERELNPLMLNITNKLFQSSFHIRET